MKFVSFNINGLRARPHQLAAIVEKHQPDVIGLQETKVHDDMFPLEEVANLGYNVFYHGVVNERNTNCGTSWLPGR